MQEKIKDDPISRQAAIDALKEWYDGMIVSSFRGIEKTIRALPSVQPEPHWIPVTERLPEDGAVCLVTFPTGTVMTSSWHEDTEYNNGFDMILHGISSDPDDNRVINYGVIAWMPLPEPYKEKP